MCFQYWWLNRKHWKPKRYVLFKNSIILAKIKFGFLPKYCIFSFIIKIYINIFVYIYTRCNEKIHAIQHLRKEYSYIITWNLSSLCHLESDYTQLENFVNWHQDEMFRKYFETGLVKCRFLNWWLTLIYYLNWSCIEILIY